MLTEKSRHRVFKQLTTGFAKNEEPVLRELDAKLLREVLRASICELT